MCELLAKDWDLLVAALGCIDDTLILKRMCEWCLSNKLTKERSRQGGQLAKDAAPVAGKTSLSADGEMERNDKVRSALAEEFGNRITRVHDTLTLLQATEDAEHTLILAPIRRRAAISIQAATRTYVQKQLHLRHRNEATQTDPISISPPNLPHFDVFMPTHIMNNIDTRVSSAAAISTPRSNISPLRDIEIETYAAKLGTHISWAIWRSTQALSFGVHATNISAFLRTRASCANWDTLSYLAGKAGLGETIGEYLQKNHVTSDWVDYSNAFYLTSHSVARETPKPCARYSNHTTSSNIRDIPDSLIANSLLTEVTAEHVLAHTNNHLGIVGTPTLNSQNNNTATFVSTNTDKKMDIQQARRPKSSKQTANFDASTRVLPFMEAPISARHHFRQSSTNSDLPGYKSLSDKPVNHRDDLILTDFTDYAPLTKSEVERKIQGSCENEFPQHTTFQTLPYQDLCDSSSCKPSPPEGNTDFSSGVHLGTVPEVRPGSAVKTLLVPREDFLCPRCAWSEHGDNMLTNELWTIEAQQSFTSQLSAHVAVTRTDRINSTAKEAEVPNEESHKPTFSDPQSQLSTNVGISPFLQVVSDKDVATALSLEESFLRVNQILADKAVADATINKNAPHPQALPRYVSNWHLMNFGPRAVAKCHEMQLHARLFKHLKAYCGITKTTNYPSVRRLRQFSDLLGVSPTRASLYSPIVQHQFMLLLRRLFPGDPRLAADALSEETPKIIPAKPIGINGRCITTPIIHKKQTDVVPLSRVVCALIGSGLDVNIDDPTTWDAPYLLQIASSEQLKWLIKKARALPQVSRRDVSSGIVTHRGIAVDDILDLVLAFVFDRAKEIQGRLRTSFKLFDIDCNKRLSWRVFSSLLESLNAYAFVSSEQAVDLFEEIQRGEETKNDDPDDNNNGHSLIKPTCFARGAWKSGVFQRVTIPSSRKSDGFQATKKYPSPNFNHPLSSLPDEGWHQCNQSMNATRAINGYCSHFAVGRNQHSSNQLTDLPKQVSNPLIVQASLNTTLRRNKPNNRPKLEGNRDRDTDTLYRREYITLQHPAPESKKRLSVSRNSTRAVVFARLKHNSRPQQGPAEPNTLQNRTVRKMY